MQAIALRALQLTFRVLDAVSPRLAGRLSLELAYYPRRRSPLRSDEAELANRAARRFIVVNGKRVAVSSWGSGETVLLVHGHESRGLCFASLVRRLLAEGYQAVTFDAPGHGDSSGKGTDILEYQTIIEQLEKIYGGFTCVVAHSVGVLCSFYAVKEGVRCKKIVAISGICQLSYLTERIASTLKLSQRTLRNLNERIEALFAPVHDIWQRFSADHFDAPLGSEILVIHDIDDAVVDYEQAVRLHSAHAVATPIMTTHRLGHRKILSDSDVLDLVVDFIKQQPSTK